MNNINKNYNILLLISCLFLIRVIIAYINTNFFILPGFQDDARGNHITALVYLLESELFNNKSNEVHTYNFFYFNLIYYLYKFSFVSWFWSSFISSLFWLFSALIFLYLFNLIGTSKNNILLFFIFYGLLPSSIIFSSSTFRESIEILFISLIILTIIVGYKKNYLFLLITPLILIIFSMLHIVNLYASFLLVLTLIFIKFSKYIIVFKKTFFIILVISFLIMFYYFLRESLLENTNLLLQKIYKILENYHTGSVTTAYTRASYMGIMEISSFIDLLDFIFLKLSKYFLEPIIFIRKLNFLDIIVLSENIFRLYLIISFIFIYSYVNKENNILFLIFFIFFLFFEILWALGTTNWGTASRHHFVPFQLLLFSRFAINSKNFINYKKII